MSSSDGMARSRPAVAEAAVLMSGGKLDDVIRIDSGQSAIKGGNGTPMWRYGPSPEPGIAPIMEISPPRVVKRQLVQGEKKRFGGECFDTGEFIVIGGATRAGEAERVDLAGHRAHRCIEGYLSDVQAASYYRQF